MKETHIQKVERLQRTIQEYRKKGDGSPIALSYGSAPSNTTRTKEYNRARPALDFSSLNEVLSIDPLKHKAIIEPRVTMESLLEATLQYGLAPPVLPEFRGITAGGAIMGGAAESGSHRWGCFSDLCSSYELLDGKGELLRINPNKNEEIYSAITGSYGSLGALVSAEIDLIPVKEQVTLHYEFLSPYEAIERLRAACSGRATPLFIEGLILSKESAVVIEGRIEDNHSCLPTFSLDSPTSPWYFQHAQELAKASSLKGVYREKMSVRDYFFRYDLGAFWMGALVFRSPFFTRFFWEGLLRQGKGIEDHFSSDEIKRLNPLNPPPLFWRTLLRPLLGATHLWKLLHQAERWCQKRFFIQDFCLPESEAPRFCSTVLERPGIFPIWLCPIKRTTSNQLFAPHLLSSDQKDSHVINFGLYGIPSTPVSIRQITREFELFVHALGGRKVLYSRSYYSQDEFWNIYSQPQYEKLRRMTHAEGMWLDITTKVLSE